MDPNNSLTEAKVPRFFLIVLLVLNAAPATNAFLSYT